MNNIHIDFMKHRYLFLIISFVIITAGIIYGLTTGFVFDIDFKGGTNIQVDLGEAFDNNKVADIVQNITGQTPIIQKLSSSDGAVSITTDTISNETTDKVLEELKIKFPNIGESTTKNVQPSYGKELLNSAITALVVAIVILLIYIGIRFKNLGMPAAITAVIALLHDALFMIAMFAFFKFPINSSFVAVILTIIGYSINDTIIVYDRIRENKRKITKSVNLRDTINGSIMQTMRRTIYTSISTVTAILIVYVFAYVNGQTVLEQFSLPLVIGILVGTYSSVFVATSLWYIVEEWLDKRKSNTNKNKKVKSKK